MAKEQVTRHHELRTVGTLAFVRSSWAGGACLLHVPESREPGLSLFGDVVQQLRHVPTVPGSVRNGDRHTASKCQSHVAQVGPD